MLMVGGSWALLHRLWISLPLALGVLAWWLPVSYTHLTLPTNREV